MGGACTALIIHKFDDEFVTWRYEPPLKKLRLYTVGYFLYLTCCSRTEEVKKNLPRHNEALSLQSSIRVKASLRHPDAFQVTLEAVDCLR
jgi:hypothetical protein